uniref:putative type IX secretion system sortase PorU2 n=1 Tax=Persicitalea sp. TaxID=3100273 RepID=UPI00359451A9
MKKKILIFLLIGLSTAVGQTPYTNSWIDYDQPYFKITIPKAGIYQISATELDAAGFRTSLAQKDYIQLWHRGREVAVRVVGGNDGKLGSAGYVEFFSPGNTGEQDSLVYRPYSARPPTTFSLYSDDAYYFLTVSATRKGKRVQEISFINTAAKPEKFHLERQVKEYQEEWSFNNNNGFVPNLQHSYYERGENWTGKVVRGDSLASHVVPLTNRVSDPDYPIRIKALVNGRYSTYHQLKFFVGTRQFDTLQFIGFDHRSVRGIVAENELNANDQFVLAMQSESKSSLELYSLTRYEVTYPQRFVLAGQAGKYFYLIPNPSNASTVAIESLTDTEGATSRAYDVTDLENPRYLESTYENGQLKMNVPGTATGRTLYTSKRPLRTASVQEVTFKPYATGFDYVIVTHSLLESSAQAYAEYRRSAAGGSFGVLVADAKQLDDQFNYGERGPLGIRNFLYYQLKAGKKDKYLLLIGNGISFPDVLKTWADRDYVPTFGYPGSDVLLSAGLGGGQPDSETYRTGRLSASTNQQVLAYLDKIKEVEGAEADLSTKKVLHMSGGKSVEEISRLRTILGTMEPLVEDAYLKGSVETLVKRTTEPVEDVNISQQMNAGLGLVTFIGHASPTVPDLNIGFASSPASQVNNKGKYPFMYFNGCGVGNVFFRYETLATDWLMATDKGAIGGLSNSYWSYAPTSAKYLTKLYQALFVEDATLGRPIGEVLQKVSHDIAVGSPDPYDIANIHQLILLGDPAFVVFRISKPDYSINTKGLFVQSKNPSLALGKADSIQVGLVLANVGKSESNRTISVRLKRTPLSGSAVVSQHIVRAPALRDTIYLTFLNSGPLSEVEVLVDDKKEVDELRRDNNLALLALDWDRAAASVVYPASVRPDRLNPVMQVTVNGTIPANDARVGANPTVEVLLKDENPLALDSGLIEFYLKACDSCEFKKIEAGQINYLLDDDNSLRATYQASGGPGTYTLLVQGKDRS